MRIESIPIAEDQEIDPLAGVRFFHGTPEAGLSADDLAAPERRAEAYTGAPGTLLGVHYSADEEIAKSFAGMNGTVIETKPNVRRPKYIGVDVPEGTHFRDLPAEAEGHLALWRTLAEHGLEIGLFKPGDVDMQNADSLFSALYYLSPEEATRLEQSYRQQLQKEGYDGIIMKDDALPNAPMIVIEFQPRGTRTIKPTEGPKPIAEGRFF